MIARVKRRENMIPSVALGSGWSRGNALTTSQVLEMTALVTYRLSGDLSELWLS